MEHGQNIAGSGLMLLGITPHKEAEGLTAAQWCLSGPSTCTPKMPAATRADFTRDIQPHLPSDPSESSIYATPLAGAGTPGAFYKGGMVNPQCPTLAHRFTCCIYALLAALFIILGQGGQCRGQMMTLLQKYFWAHLRKIMHGWPNPDVAH